MAKKSSDYWKRRFIDLEAASNSYGVDAYRLIEREFEKAQRNIEGAIEAWYGRFAKNNEITMQEARKLLTSSELKEFKWDVKEYIKYGRENDLNQLWMKELENASAKFHISRLEALKVRTQQAAEVAFGNELDAVDSMVRKVFTEDYYHSVYELQKGFNIGWEIGQIDEKKLSKLVSKPWAADGKNFSDRIWEQRTQLVNELHSQLTRTCILGKAPDNAIKAIAKKFGVSKNQAGRLVMTEQAYAHAVAQKEAFEELDVEEFEIVATLDSSTSAICQEMDGKHFPMKEYEPGVTAPPFHPWCRSVTVPYFDDEFNVGERAARDENGETYYVPSNVTYKDWKKSMVDGKTQDLTKTLTNVSSNDTIQMGALSGALNPDSAEASKHAFQYYESVRKMKHDCEAISKRTGYSISFVEDVKNHLFLTKHDLGSGELEYFFPDYEIAQSWQRLMDSNMDIQPHDIILLEHEHAEYVFMQQGMSQAQAHELAEERYNYEKALRERK